MKRIYSEKDIHYQIIQYNERASIDKLKKDDDKLWKTLSKQQKELAGGVSETDPSVFKYLIKRFKMIDKDSLDIIGIFDILKRVPKDKTNKDLCCQIVINPAYQNKGYGTILAKEATNWYKKNKSKYGDIDWACLRNNKASIKLAEKCGWTYMDNISDEDWAVYNFK